MKDKVVKSSTTETRTGYMNSTTEHSLEIPGRLMTPDIQHE